MGEAHLGFEHIGAFTRIGYFIILVVDINIIANLASILETKKLNQIKRHSVFTVSGLLDNGKD